MEHEQLTSFETGAVVFGRFEIIRCLGVGSIGTVYLVRSVNDPEEFLALKVLSAQAARDKTVSLRFRNEIHALYRISHSNIVRGFEFFRFEGGMAFTMEYVEGCKLSDLIQPHKPLPLEEVLIILRQLCVALRTIHTAGIVHRDLKPDNILITQNGMVKVTDFSVAKFEGTSQLTVHGGGMLGTVDYLSPEYLEEGDLDLRTDIYALGIIAYQMITGILPFEGQNLLEKVSTKLHYDLVPPHEIRRDCPRELSIVVAKACSREAHKRYQGVEAMIEDLVGCGLVSAEHMFSGMVETDALSQIAEEPRRRNKERKQYGTKDPPSRTRSVLVPAPSQSMLRVYRNILFAVSIILALSLVRSVWEIFLSPKEKEEAQTVIEPSSEDSPNRNSMHIVVGKD